MTVSGLVGDPEDSFSSVAAQFIFYDQCTCLPSSSAGGGPARDGFGVFMNNGNMVLRPRMSTNF